MCCARVLSMLVMLTLLRQRHGMIQFLALSLNCIDPFFPCKVMGGYVLSGAPFINTPFAAGAALTCSGCWGNGSLWLPSCRNEYRPRVLCYAVPNREEANLECSFFAWLPSTRQGMKDAITPPPPPKFLRSWLSLVYRTAVFT